MSPVLGGNLVTPVHGGFLAVSSAGSEACPVVLSWCRCGPHLVVVLYGSLDVRLYTGK